MLTFFAWLFFSLAVIPSALVVLKIVSPDGVNAAKFLAIIGFAIALFLFGLHIFL